MIAYFHGVKTRLSTSGTGDVPGSSDSRYKSRVSHKTGGHKRITGEAGIATDGVKLSTFGVSTVGSQSKLGTLD